MNKYLFNLHEMKWYGSQNKIVLNENTSSGTDKVSLSHHDILSLENEKATLLICIGLFLHLFFFFVEIKHTKFSTSHLWLHVDKKETIHNMTWE